MEAPSSPAESPDLDPERLATLRRNLAAVRDAMRAASERSGRAPGECRLLAVVKRRRDAELRALIQLGVEDLAENRVQGAAARPAGLLPPDRLHMIGSLQTNKVRRALELFGTLHCLDRPRLLEALRAAASERPAPLPVYVQVNMSGEPQKHGVLPGEAAALCEAASRAPELELRGLMTMAAHAERAEDARPCFAGLRELGAELRRQGAMPHSATGLSMGMSGDYEVAIEEGSTLVRVGTALFLDEPLR